MLTVMQEKRVKRTNKMIIVARVPNAMQNKIPPCDFTLFRS